MSFKSYFIIELDPLPSPRPRFSKFRTYMPKKYSDYKNQVVEMIKRELPSDFEKYDCGLKLTINFYVRIPKSYSKKRKMELHMKKHTKKPDLDNLIKTYKDAMNEVVYNDDCQINVIEATKCWSLNPFIEIKLERND